MQYPDDTGTGGISPKLFCTFRHPKLNPVEIKLPLGVNGVKWTYQLRHNVISTIGGQVFQILGANVGTITIKGQFGMAGMWGLDAKKDYRGPLVNGTIPPGALDWQDSTDINRNGLVQMGLWFRQYFLRETQGSAKIIQGSFEEEAIEFSFPARNWNFLIRPTSFPQVRFANDNTAPEWLVEADVVEPYERHEGTKKFTQEVDKFAREDLASLKAGLGYRRLNPFSDPLADPDLLANNYDPVELAKKVAESYSDYVQNFGADEIEELIYQGFSSPTQTSLFEQEIEATETENSTPKTTNKKRPVDSRGGNGS
jgi:hypothetical protein